MFNGNVNQAITLAYAMTLAQALQMPLAMIIKLNMAVAIATVIGITMLCTGDGIGHRRGIDNNG